MSFEPETKLSNLPLSVHGILVFADQIGATDQLLLMMLSMYLKKFRPTLLDILDTKKAAISPVIEALAFHCTTDHEKAVVLDKLRRFRRDEHEAYAACITRFDSLYVFYLQLDQPSETSVI